VTGSPDGGTYVFAWDLNKRLHTAHLVVPAVLMLLVTTVVFAAHRVLKRLLLPLQLLGEGVAGVAEGRFDVVVPKRSADEFGALTDAFNRMVTRVKDMVRARDRLLLDVSHELRSPLTRLKVALSLLEEHDVKTRMSADVAEMEMMIAELLELERLRDTHGISVAEHDLLPLLHETAESFQNRPPGVRVMSVSRELLTKIDREKVRTVVRNLLENAFKYSLPTSRPVEISAAQRADGIEVRVSDDGIGIPAEDVERVFEPFFRVDPSRSKSTGGYGLGLSICKRVMEAHGGSIAVERLAGRGTSFILTFPASALAKSA
jgi:signal transduction histidine kinase